jgi:ethanolamine transporter EutH
MQRRILGVAAVAFLLIAAGLWWWQPQMEVELAFFSRMGAVLVAAWLAYDDVQRLPGWLLLLLPVVLIVAVRWPRLLWLLIPALALWAVLRRVLPGGQT